MPSDNLYAAAVEGGSQTFDQGVVARGLFDNLYADLHRMARRELYRRGAVAVLGATSVLHEAYLKVSENSKAVFVDRARFMAYAARVMRTLIIDEVRRRRSHKRGGQFRITALGTHHGNEVADPGTLLKLSDVLDELAQVEPDVAAIVELRFFGGFSFAEIATMRGVSAKTIQRSWDRGRLYLHRAMATELLPR
jgi:RNA polymerase sigma factor (TIGR02999 family)